MNTLKNLHFLAKNGFINEEKRTLKNSIRFLIKMILFLLFIKIVYLGLILFIESFDAIKIPTVTNSSKLDMYSGVQKFLFSAFLIPIIEELTFRLKLIFSKRNFLIMFTGITYITLKITLQIDKYSSLFITITLALLLGFLLKNNTLKRVEKFWKINRLLIFYFLLFSFAILHATNYKLEASTLIYTPLLILPQLLAGFIYSYVRLNSGIIMSISLHIFNNGLFAFPLLFT